MMPGLKRILGEVLGAEVRSIISIYPIGNIMFTARRFSEELGRKAFSEYLSSAYTPISYVFSIDACVSERLLRAVERVLNRDLSIVCQLKQIISMATRRMFKEEYGFEPDNVFVRSAYKVYIRIPDSLDWWEKRELIRTLDRKYGLENVDINVRWWVGIDLQKHVDKVDLGPMKQMKEMGFNPKEVFTLLAILSSLNTSDHERAEAERRARSMAAGVKAW